MSRDPRRAARVLGLWTACWLAVFLVAGMLWLGEPSVQWPVLAVPLLWALVALRPRRRPAAEQRWDDELRDDERWDGDRWDDDRWDDDRWDDDQGDPDDRGHPRSSPDVPPGRTDTVERSSVRRPDDEDPWGRDRRR